MEWTTVRYGKRRQQPRPQQQDRRRDQGFGRVDRGMESARAFSGRRRPFSPYPSRPVPPPARPTRYTGPQRQRSYADTVRWGLPRPNQWRRPVWTGNPDVLRQSAGPQLQRLIRKLKAVIKVVHHLQNVSPKPGKPEPRMISRMVEILSEMIKPAFPTDHTVDFIVGNAKNWGHNTYLILEEHYKASLEARLEELGEMLTQDWKKAFEVAVRWVRRDLPRIPQDVIDHAEAVITARLEPRGTAGSAQRPILVDCSVQAREPTQEPTQVPPQPKTVTFQTQTAPEKTSVATMTDQDQVSEWSPLDDEEEVVESPRDQRRRGGRKTVGVIMNRPPSSWRFDSDSEDQEELNVVPRVVSHSTYLEEQSSTPVPTPQVPLQVLAQVHHTESSLAEESGEAEFNNTPSPNTSRHIISQANQAMMASLPLFSPDTSEDEVEAQILEEAFQDSLSLTNSPQPQLSRVRRHNNTQRKLTDWSLKVEKKWMVMGDSNLASFPDFAIPDLQIESFPGAHFRHAHALLEKLNTPENLAVEKVVLAFGINNRANKFKETTMKSVQSAVRSIKKRFPVAEIWIPQVNFAATLPADERENLDYLNAYLKRNLPYIPLLPDDKFQTEEDDVHWTAETSEAMFHHWMSFLNFLPL